MRGKPVRVLYCIFSSHSTSGGGHFHSLKTIVNGLSNDVDSKILNAGVVLGKPLKGTPNTDFVSVTRATFWKGIRSIRSKVKSYDPDVLHAFDFKSLWICRLVGYWLGKPVVFTKCGGRNGSNFIPRADVYILFSGENLAHYQNQGPSNGEYHLIPNRVKRIKQDQKRIQELRDQISVPTSANLILRISRVVPYYERTYRLSIALLKEKLKVDRTAQLIFLGFIQDQAFYQRLKEEVSGLPVTFVTDEVFCKDAAQLLTVADSCVATGRGAMEAATVGLEVYCTVAGKELPVLLNEDSLPGLLHYNFSERASGITKSFPNAREEDSGRGVQELFDQSFLIENAVEKYLKIYKTVRPGPANGINFVLHGLRFFKSLI